SKKARILGSRYRLTERELPHGFAPSLSGLSGHPAAFEIGGTDVLVGEQLLPGAGQRDMTGLHDIAAMREAKRVMRILLDEEHRYLLFLVDRADDIEDLLYDHRREAERGFVE